MIFPAAPWVGKRRRTKRSDPESDPLDEDDGDDDDASPRRWRSLPRASGTGTPPVPR